MSNMKDYMMWLDDRGIAEWNNSIGELVIPSGTNAYSPELVDEYKDDAKWHFLNDEDIDDQWNRMGGAYNQPKIETDDDDFIINDEQEDLLDDDELGDLGWTPEDYWFTPDGGLTGDAYTFLHTTDLQGDFV